MDVSILDSWKNNGLQCVELINDYLNYYPGLLRPLYLVVKSLLIRLGLADKKTVRCFSSLFNSH